MFMFSVSIIEYSDHIWNIQAL